MKIIPQSLAPALLGSVVFLSGVSWLAMQHSQKPTLSDAVASSASLSPTPAITPTGAWEGTIKQCDVLVIGGTPAGVSASLAAARRGAKVILVEKNEHLGGDIVYAMLNMFDVPMRPNGTSPVAYGIFGEFFRELGIGFDINEARHLFDTKVAAERNIETFRLTEVTGILKTGKRINGAILETRERDDAKDTPPLKVLAKVVIDATNDADFAARAGAHYTLGRQASGLDRKMQSASLLFAVSGANWDVMKSYVRSVRLMPAANRIGQEYASDVAPTTSKEVAAKTTKETPTKPIPHRMGGVDGNYIWERGDVIKGYRPHGRGLMVLSINFGRQREDATVLNTINMVGVNGLDFHSKEKARQLAINELQYFLPYLRKAMPGLQNIRLAGVAEELYVRETRHIQGFYSLNVKDIRAQTRFPDRIAWVSYPIDLHPYNVGDVNPFGPKRYFYTLPLRSLVPKTIDGVFVASRCLSATYEAAGSSRVIPITMAAGEAAGTAAWMCVRQNLTPHKMAQTPSLWKPLQQNLRAAGMKLDDKI